MAANPLLEDLNTGDITSVSIALPTLGYFYPTDSGIVDESVDLSDLEVKPLGIMAELVAKDPFVLASGKGIPRLIRSVCPSILKPEELCEVDLEAILLACRLASYGNTLSISPICMNPKTEEEGDSEGNKVTVPVCNHKNEIVVDLYQHIQRYSPLEDMEDLLMTIPELNNQQVHLKPANYKSAVLLMKNTMQINRAYDRISSEDVSALLEDGEIIDTYEDITVVTAQTQFEMILGSIFYVAKANGEKVVNPDFIREWLELIPGSISSRMKEKAKAYNEKLSKLSEIKFTCGNCGYENTIPLELDPQKIFFYAPEALKPETISSSTSKTNETKKKRPSKTSPNSARRMRARSSSTTSKKPHPEK